MLVLIEDDESTLESISELLDYLHIEHRAARTTKEGLALIEQFKPSVLLTDLWLGNEDARALIDACKKYNYNCIPILITASNENQAKLAASAMNVVHLVLKPFNFEDLEKLLRQVTIKNSA